MEKDPEGDADEESTFVLEEAANEDPEEDAGIKGAAGGGRLEAGSDG